MQVQFDNRLISSFLLMIDHEVQKRGVAYKNYSGALYPTPGYRSNTSVYAAPFKGWCNDTSIVGANIASGVYLNNQFVTIGQSGLTAINHYQGAAYFTGQLPANTSVTASYAIKDFNVFLTDQTEWKLLFEEKIQLNGKYAQDITGISLDTRTFPAIFIRTKTQDSRPFALGGYDNNMIGLRAIVLADTEFQRIAVCNILKNMNYRPIPIVTGTPFDAQSRFTGANYNYDQLLIDPSFSAWILGARAIDVPQEGQYDNTFSNIARVDFDISTVLRHTY